MASSSINALSDRLRTVAGKGNCDEIEQLLRLGATFEPDKYGRTVLHYAAHHGQAKAIRLLAARGCDLDTEDSYGCTPLHKAVAPDGQVEAVRALLEEGCSVERQDLNGNTALHEAAWNGFSQTLEVLIKVGKANIHAGNKTGQKPIHLACQNGHNQSTRLLLKAGTHPNIKNNSNETPLHTACLFGHITCARILLSAECDANVKNKEGNTALHLAASLGKVKISRLLLEAECDVKIRNKGNQTALELARLNDHKDVVLLILGAARIKKGKQGKLPFFSRKKKKDGDKSQGFGDSFHHHSDSSHHKHDDRGKHRHGRGLDDADGGQGGLRVRGRRETEGMDRHSSGSSKGKSKKRRDQRREDSHLRVEEARGQNLFVREELKRKVKNEKEAQDQIQRGRDMASPLFRMQPFKDKTGKILEVPIPVQCNCTPYIKKLENQVEASKERLLHEIDMNKARFESRMNNMEKRMTHQSQCMDQLCKERIAAERADCIHRIDERANEEREKIVAEQNAKADVLRNELREWFQARIQPLHEQLSRTCLDDAVVNTSSDSRRTRRRAEFYRSRGREMGMMRKRSKSVGDLSDCDVADEDDEEDESDDESEDEEEVLEEVYFASRRLREERQKSSRQPAEQLPHRHKKTDQARGKDYSKTGAIPKASRSGSFRQAVSDEDRHSGSSSNSGTPLSMVAGIYRPPLVASHERSPADSHPSQSDFMMPSQDTDDTESETESDSETASQLSLETVSYKPKSDVSSSTRDSGNHTLKGSSISTDRRSQTPTRADMIAYQALTVNARPPPPLQAQNYTRPPVTHQPPPTQLQMQRMYTPPFSPPVSPTSTASQPLSSSTDGARDSVLTPRTEPSSSENPSPTDSGKTPSTSSGVSSGDALPLPHTTPIKYNIISPHTGKSQPHTYNPRNSTTYQADLIKDATSRNRTANVREDPPPQYSVHAFNNRANGSFRTFGVVASQPGARNSNNANNNASSNGGHDASDSARTRLGSVSSNHSYSVSHQGSSNPPKPSVNAGHVSNVSAINSSASGAPQQPRSAASRLGVKPSLSGVKNVTSQASSHGSNGAQISRGSTPQPQTYIPNPTRTAYSGGYIAIGSNGTIVTGNGLSVSQSNYSNAHQRSVAPPRAGNPTVSAAPSYNHSRTVNANGGNVNANNQNSAKGHYAAPPGARTVINGTSGTNAANPLRTNGASRSSNGASGGNIINEVEQYNKSAAPEQKLKYTREIVL